MRYSILLLAYSTLIAASFCDAADATKKSEQTEAARLQCWVDLYRGEPLPYKAVVADLAGSRVIYLGERHNLMRHHKIQERIVNDLAKRGVPLVLAMEQIEADDQPKVDRYNRGEIDFDELARSIGWGQRWHGYESYRGVVEAARKAGAPVLALNARRETIRQLARSGGLDRLAPNLRKELPDEIQLKDPDYEHLLNLRLAVHMAAMGGRLQPMVEAQIARDEQMASALSDYLKSEEGKSRVAVVLCGSMHCAHGLGTVSRVRRRMPGVKDRIILMSESGDVKITPAMKAVTRPVKITHEDLRRVNLPIAGYLHIISRKPPQ